MPEERLVICANCKFPNMPGARLCLTCKAPLRALRPPGPGASDAELPTQAVQIPSIVDTPTRPFVRTRQGLRPAEPRPQEAHEAPDGPIVAWLRCEPLPPIALGPKHSVSMGRGQECDLILPHPTVSRVHAVVRVLGRQLVFEDRSSYGSFINQKPTSSTQLQVGDRIGIGPYEVRVLGPDATESEAPGEEEHTQPLDFTSFRQVPAQAELLGSLERSSLLEILQTIELNRKTGLLKVTAGSVAGELVLRDGRPLTATLGALRDEEAVYSMLLLRTGSFCFWGAEPGEVEASMTTPITRLLLEASRRLDDLERASASDTDLDAVDDPSSEDTHHPGPRPPGP